MALDAAQLQAAYLTAWMEGLSAFQTATSSDDTAALDSIDARLAQSRAALDDEAGHPLDRLAGLGYTDGYQVARTGYSAAMKAAPWHPALPR